MRKPIRSRYVALFALAGFLAHALLPFLAIHAVPLPSRSDRADLALASGASIPICTPLGIKWISADQHGENDAPSSPAKSLDCPFCCGPSHGGKCFIPACHVAIVYAPASYLLAYQPDGHRPGRAQVLFHNRSVRGPPLTA